MRFYITPQEYEVAAGYGIDKDTVDRRVRSLCWPVEKAITKPKRPQTDRRKWAAIAAKNGIGYQTFMSRINKWGWSEEAAANTPLQDRQLVALRNSEAKRKYPKELIETAARNGIAYNTLRTRIRRGWDPEKAANTPVVPKSEAGRRGKANTISKYGDWNKVKFKGL